MGKFGVNLNSKPAQEERNLLGISKEDQAKSFGIQPQTPTEPSPLQKVPGFQDALSGFQTSESQQSTKAQRDLDVSVEDFKALPLQVQQQFEQFKPLFNKAVKVAENNPRNHGVLSVKVNSPEEANSVLDRSLRNNFVRWLKAGAPGSFVEFFQQRWAPIGANNDPNGLNKNFVRSVTSSLKSQLSEQDFNFLKQQQILLP